MKVSEQSTSLREPILDSEFDSVLSKSFQMKIKYSNYSEDSQQSEEKEVG